jgi:RNA polymerase sigma factor (sigma-70 family)
MGAPSTPAAPAPEGGFPIHQRLLSDERLARLVEDGSERAFAMIYERYHQRLYRYCRSLLRDGDDAYDALQSTLANALAALQRGRRDAPLRPWLFRIAHNESISLIRRREPDRGSFDATESCVPSAEARADERARLALLVSDLGELPERQRAVLLMREVSGLSRKDIASALGLSVQTVGRALLAARRSLGEFEEGRAMVCEQVQRSISLADGRLPPRARAHVRDCAACAAFAAAIPARRADLQALAPPLAPIPAAALFAVVHGATSTQGAGGGVMAAGLSGKTAGAALAAKALASVAIVAVASASATGVASKLTSSAKPSVNAASPAHTSAPKRHLRQTARTRAPRAHQEAALAPAARIDAGPPASAVDATSNAPGVSSGPTGAVGQAKTASAAVPAQDGPSRSGPPVHPTHPHGGGAVHGRSTTATSHARGSGATGAARSAHGTGAATERRETPGAASGNGHAGGSHARSSEPASTNPGANPEHGRPAEASSAPPPQSEPPSPAGEKHSPPAHEEAGGHGLGGQHGDAGGPSPQTSDG